jgi:hypothetical protein
LQIVSVEDMTEGIDLRRSKTLLEPGRARTLKNYSLSEPGALTVRAGYQAASSASLGSKRAQGGQRVYLASTAFSLVAYDGAVKRPADDWVWGSDVLTGLSSANQVYFPFDRDVVMAMDGVWRPRLSTNGTNWLLAGIDAPSSAATLSSVSTGSLSSGEFAIAYTYKHRGTTHESNASSESTITITASSGSIHATASPSTDTKVDAYVWYARHKLPDGESILRKVSSGAASTITITSSAWTSADEVPTNHTPPVSGLRFARVWKNRWWAPDGTVGNRLRFTELFQAQTWPSNYYIDIPFEKGDNITAVQALGDTLLVYGESGVFLIVGQTSLDFEVRPSQGADTGALGPRAVARVEQSDVHASADGVNLFDGADRDLERDIAPAWRDLVQSVASTALALIAMAHDALEHEVRIAVPRVYPTGARGEWVLNLDRTRDNNGVPAWTTTDRDIAFYMPWDGNEPTAGNRGRLFSMPSNAGMVYEENVGTTANSSNMVAEYEGPTLSLGLHRARVIGVHLEHEPHAGAWSINVLTDGVSQGDIAIDIGAGLFPYGSTVTYGTASRTYGGSGRSKPYTHLPLSAEGRTVALTTVYRGQEAFKHFTYSVEIVPAPAPGRLN